MPASPIQSTVPVPQVSTPLPSPFPDTPMVRRIVAEQIPVVKEAVRALSKANSDRIGFGIQVKDQNQSNLNLVVFPRRYGPGDRNTTIASVPMEDVRPNHLGHILSSAQEWAGAKNSARAQNQAVEKHNETCDNGLSLGMSAHKIRLRYTPSHGSPGTGVSSPVMETVESPEEFIGDIRNGTRKIDPLSRAVIDAAVDTIQAGSGKRSDTMALRYGARMVADYSYRRALNNASHSWSANEDGTQSLDDSVLCSWLDEPSYVAGEALSIIFDSHYTKGFPVGGLDHMHFSDAQVALAKCVKALSCAGPEDFVDAAARLGGDGYRCDRAALAIHDIITSQGSHCLKETALAGHTRNSRMHHASSDGIIDAYQLARVSLLANDIGQTRVRCMDDIEDSRNDLKAFLTSSKEDIFHGSGFLPPVDMTSPDSIRESVGSFINQVFSIAEPVPVFEMDRDTSPMYKDFRESWDDVMGRNPKPYEDIGVTSFKGVSDQAAQILRRQSPSSLSGKSPSVAEGTSMQTISRVLNLDDIRNRSYQESLSGKFIDAEQIEKPLDSRGDWKGMKISRVASLGDTVTLYGPDHVAGGELPQWVCFGNHQQVKVKESVCS